MKLIMQQLIFNATTESQFSEKKTETHQHTFAFLGVGVFDGGELRVGVLLLGNRVEGLQPEPPEPLLHELLADPVHRSVDEPPPGRLVAAPSGRF